jgi:hypothetical protein
MVQMELTVEDLRDLRDRALADPLSPEERILKSAAQFGYSVATLDLPIELSRSMDKSILKPLLTQLKELLPGATFCIVEEEYEGQTLYRLEVGW